jgi:putative FmdB family regulatory protein
MATYVYTCAHCAADFELKRPMAEAGLPGACPACGAACARRPASFGFVKGGRARKDAAAASASPAKKAHVAGCPCCTPRKSVKTQASAGA